MRRNKKEIEQSLRRAVNDLPNIDFDAIATAEVEKMTRHDHYTMQQETQEHPAKKRWKPITVLASLVAVFVLLFPVMLGTEQGIYTATLDINPSIELTFNEDMELISAEALNADAEIILARSELDYNNLATSLDVLIEVLQEEGYFEADENVILLSVKGNDEALADQLTKTLDEQIGNGLANNGVQAVVLSQTYTEDKEAEQLSKTYDVSEGKIRLIQQIVMQNRNYELEDLVGLTMREIYAFAQQNGTDLSEYVSDRQSNQEEDSGQDNGNGSENGNNEETTGGEGNQDDKSKDDENTDNDNQNNDTDQNGSGPGNGGTNSDGSKKK